MQRITKIEDVFLVTGRGLIVVPGPLRSEIAGGSDLPVELRLPDGTVLHAFASLQHFFQSPPPPPDIAEQWGCVLAMPSNLSLQPTQAGCAGRSAEFKR